MITHARTRTRTHARGRYSEEYWGSTKWDQCALDQYAICSRPQRQHLGITAKGCPKGFATKALWPKVPNANRTELQCALCMGSRRHFRRTDCILGKPLQRTRPDGRFWCNAARSLFCARSQGGGVESMNSSVRDAHALFRVSHDSSL